jgi:uncharacterized protein YdbL (DUF1318 family)
MKHLIATLLLLLALQNAWAIDIDDAKSQGLVGEATNGYLAAVKAPANAEVQTLITEVNAKRTAQFKKAAAKTGATVEQVRYRFYEIAVERTESGNFYQDKNGGWKKK